MMIRTNSTVISSVSILWLFLCVFGLSKLAVYEHTPGLAKEGPTAWPEVGLAKGADYTLVLSIHPQCPCTRATLQELALAMTHCPKMHAYLLFIKPDGVKESWVKSDLWTTASHFPRCTLIVDEGAKLSSAFHAHISGQSYLYDPRGQLIYSGGITGSRGHAGDNNGLDSIISLANKETTTASNNPVFGCPLFANNVSCDKKSGN
jgi:hypothetical protein